MHLQVVPKLDKHDRNCRMVGRASRKSSRKITFCPCKTYRQQHLHQQPHQHPQSHHHPQHQRPLPSSSSNVKFCPAKKKHHRLYSSSGHGKRKSKAGQGDRCYSPRGLLAQHLKSIEDHHYRQSTTTTRRKNRPGYQSMLPQASVYHPSYQPPFSRSYELMEDDDYDGGEDAQLAEQIYDHFISQRPRTDVQPYETMSPYLGVNYWDADRGYQTAPYDGPWAQEGPEKARLAATKAFSKAPIENYPSWLGY